MAAQQAIAMPAMLAKEAKKLDSRVPAIVRLDMRVPLMQGAVRDAVQLMARRWEEGDARKTTGRALKAIRHEQTQDDIQKGIQTHLPSDDISATLTGNSMQAMLEPNVFAVAQAKESVNHEKGFLASVRVLHGGTRTIVMAPMLDVIEVFSEVHGKDANKTNANVRDFFATMNAEQVKRVASRGRLYHGSASKGDAIFTPSGFVLLERIGKSEDCVGIKLPLVFTDCVSVPEISFPTFRLCCEAQCDPVRL
eukprot:6462235-Amphidinium_carterae.5